MDSLTGMFKSKEPEVTEVPQSNNAPQQSTYDIMKEKAGKYGTRPIDQNWASVRKAANRKFTNVREQATGYANQAAAKTGHISTEACEQAKAEACEQAKAEAVQQYIDEQASKKWFGGKRKTRKGKGKKGKKQTKKVKKTRKGKKTRRNRKGKK